MAILYKLTDQNGQTYNQTQWGENVTHETSGVGDMRGPGWTHAHKSALLAAFLNVILGNISDPQLWEAEGEIVKFDGCKVGTTKLTTIKQIPLPVVSLEQRIKFAILCALEVYKDSNFKAWADLWLTGRDRTKSTAMTMKDAIFVKWDTERATKTMSETERGAAESACAAVIAAIKTKPLSIELESAEAASWATEANPNLRLEDIAERAVA